MANPDIVDVATINAESVAFTLTATTTTTLLTVSADVVLKINSIHAANDDGTNDATIDLSVVKQTLLLLVFLILIHLELL